MKRLIASAVVLFASQAVVTFGGDPVASSNQVAAPSSGFFRSNEFDLGAFGTFAIIAALGPAQMATGRTLRGWRGFHLLVSLEKCRRQVPREGEQLTVGFLGRLSLSSRVQGSNAITRCGRTERQLRYHVLPRCLIYLPVGDIRQRRNGYQFTLIKTGHCSVDHILSTGETPILP